MSHKLTIEISDRAFESLAREAQTSGISPALVASTELERRFSNGTALETNADGSFHRKPAMGELRALFGCVNVPDPKGADNELIDADLAKEYGSTHENS
jgi:hypothetical protein